MIFDVTKIRLQTNETDEVELVITLAKSFQYVARKWLAEAKKLVEDGKLLTVDIGLKKKKRSLDANAYCWVLLKKISEVLRTSDKEVYREIIKRVGQYQIVPIANEVVGAWVQKWESNGIGWQTENIGECRNTKGYSNIKCYFGSSSYDSKEMAVLIDEIVTEAKELDIETMTPGEIERLKVSWK